VHLIPDNLTRISPPEKTKAITCMIQMESANTNWE